MRKFVLAVAASGLMLAASAWAGSSETAASGGARELRGFALARCLGAAFQQIRAEADAAAGGYVETGSAPFEAYAEIDALAVGFLERDYPSKSGSDLSIMKCFDLLESDELAAAVARHTAGEP